MSCDAPNLAPGLHIVDLRRPIAPRRKVLPISGELDAAHDPKSSFSPSPPFAGPINARFMDEGMYEADVERALDLRVVDDEPIAPLLLPIRVDRRQLEVVEEVVHVGLLTSRWRGRWGRCPPRGWARPGPDEWKPMRFYTPGQTNSTIQERRITRTWLIQLNSLAAAAATLLQEPRALCISFPALARGCTMGIQHGGVHRSRARPTAHKDAGRRKGGDRGRGAALP
jgi:hypothetical protein